jgi:hypothetical protein
LDTGFTFNRIKKCLKPIFHEFFQRIEARFNFLEPQKCNGILDTRKALSQKFLRFNFVVAPARFPYAHPMLVIRDPQIGGPWTLINATCMPWSFSYHCFPFFLAHRARAARRALSRRSSAVMRLARTAPPFLPIMAAALLRSVGSTMALL